ncbi:MAG TPA: hypothetical protein VEH56_05270 [Candidatus Saccharimonadales bacterium]|nr:hypothetical protein [Candidatus Saccharimonadales bacterium]
MSEEYKTCRCGAKFTNDEIGKKLYDQHQSWCGKQGMTSSPISEPGRNSKHRTRKTKERVFD